MSRRVPMVELAGACLVLAFTASASAQEIVHRGGRADPAIALRLWIPDGEVQVQYWERDSVDIQAGLTKGVQLVGGIGGAVGKYAIEHSALGATGFARAKITLTVPSRATLWVKSTKASVTVFGGQGQLDVMTVTGRIVIRDALGPVTLESIAGEMELLQLRGVVRVHGGSGTVTLNDLRGHTTVTMVSGTVLVNPQAGRAQVPAGRLETVDGDVRVQGVLASGSRLDIQTHGGSITLGFLKGGVPRITADESRQPAIDAQVARLGGATPDRRIVINTFKGKINVGIADGIK